MPYMEYGKFRKTKGIPTRAGMTLTYGTPLVALVVSAWPYLSSPNAHQVFVLACLSAHFIKRLLESWFMHKYSGSVNPFAAIAVACFYSLTTFFPGYINREPLSDIDSLALVGFVVFLIGESLNFVHHKILADLRTTSMEYVIPRGSLFNLVVCPHYLFEIVAWFGLCLIFQHVSLFLLFLAMVVYLIVRSLLTLKWYRERFSNFPSNRRAILPFIL